MVLELTSSCSREIVVSVIGYQCCDHGFEPPNQPSTSASLDKGLNDGDTYWHSCIHEGGCKCPSGNTSFRLQSGPPDGSSPLEILNKGSTHVKENSSGFISFQGFSY